VNNVNLKNCNKIRWFRTIAADILLWSRYWARYWI